MACLCMQPFPDRNAEQKSDEARREERAHVTQEWEDLKALKVERREQVKEKPMDRSQLALNNAAHVQNTC